MGTLDFSVGDADAFALEEALFFVQAGGEAGEAAVGADDAVAGNLWGVGVFVESVADSAVGAGAEDAGDIAVADYLAAGDAGGGGPDFLVEGHLFAYEAGFDFVFEHGNSEDCRALVIEDSFTLTLSQRERGLRRRLAVILEDLKRFVMVALRP
jgi:hypothetical protein